MTMAETLERVELFSQVPAVDLERVASLAVRRHVTKGEVIVKQGEVGVAFYVIVAGEAEVTVNRDGTEERLSLIGPRACFGEMALFENQVRSATVTALEDTDLIVLTRWDFLAEIKNPGSGLAVALLAELAGRIRALDSNNHRS